MPVSPDESDQPKGQLLIYADAGLRLQVRLDGRTLWLPQRQMADLYQVSVPSISQHVAAVFDDGELAPEATVKQYLMVQTEGGRRVQRAIDHYSLDVILAVGYRHAPQGIAYQGFHA